MSHDPTAAHFAGTPDPIARFAEALARAQETEADVPSAASLATVDPEGHPSARVVLVRGVDARGFSFYTNYRSRKGEHLAENPHAALCVHWKSLGHQVRIEGRVGMLSAKESDAYFASRPQRSQLAAIASEQSRPLEDRAAMQARFDELVVEHGDRPAPRPTWWGGYRLVPARIEFWYHGDHRLHDRVLYSRDGVGWRVARQWP
jgi:pyridoxamine 5'-phosphate oxidase